MMSEADTEEKHLEGRRSLSVSSLTGMLGWNSVGVFGSKTHLDGDTLHVNKGAVFVVLSDPYPEYKEFVFLNGEFHHSSSLLKGEYEGVLKDHFESHGEAEVFPLSAVDFIERNDGGIPTYTED